MATWLGPDLSSPKLTLPTGVSVWPAMEKTETVPSDRLATSARVPARLIDTPAAPCPACNCAATLGGEALRSITVTLSSGTVFFGSAGSILDAPVTSAKLSSRAIATLDGGPITLVGAGISATTLGGVALRSMTVTESAGGLAGTAFTPSMRTAFPSLAESASSPLAPDDSDINAASESAPTPPIWRCMRTSSRCADRYGLANAPRTRPHCDHLSKQTGENLPCPVRLRRITVRSEPGGGRQRPRPGGALRLEQVGQQERKVDRLLGIEPRVADRVVAILEVRVGDHAGTAGALGDVLAGHLQMHAAAVRSFGAVNRKEGFHLRQDAVERSRLVAGFRGDGVAVHGIARPQHDLSLALNRADHGRKLIADLVRAQPHDQRQPARLVFRIEDVDQPQHLIDLARRSAFESQRIDDAAAELDMRVIGLSGAVADPQHVRRGAAEGAGVRRVLARHLLLVAEQQRLVAGVEVGALELGMAFEIEPASLHETERLGDAVGELLVMVGLRRVLDEAERPLPHIREIGIAALHESAQQIERGGRVAIGLDLALGIRTPRRFIEVDTVDDIAVIARQLLAVPFLHRRRAWLRELAGYASDVHHRQGGGIGQHHRHLQEHAQEVADVVGADIVGAVLGEGFGAISTLQQKALPRRNAAERLFQAAGFACKNEGRKRRKLPLDRGERRLIRIVGDLDDRLAAPTVARPTLGHDGPPPRLSPGTGEIFQFGDLIHEGRRCKPDGIASMRPERGRNAGAIRPPRGDGSAPSPVASPVPRRRSDAPR